MILSVCEWLFFSSSLHFVFLVALFYPPPRFSAPNISLFFSVWDLFICTWRRGVLGHPLAEDFVECYWMEDGLFSLPLAVGEMVELAPYTFLTCSGTLNMQELRFGTVCVFASWKSWLLRVQQVVWQAVSLTVHVYSNNVIFNRSNHMTKPHIHPCSGVCLVVQLICSSLQQLSGSFPTMHGILRKLNSQLEPFLCGLVYFKNV